MNLDSYFIIVVRLCFDSFFFSFLSLYLSRTMIIRSFSVSFLFNQGHLILLVSFILLLLLFLLERTCVGGTKHCRSTICALLAYTHQRCQKIIWKWKDKRKRETGRNERFVGRGRIWDVKIRSFCFNLLRKTKSKQWKLVSLKQL